jgi:hypothetical protein
VSAKLRAFGVLATILLVVSSAEAQTTAQPGATAFYGVDAGIARPSCVYCSDPEYGPAVGLFAFAPLGSYFAVGIALEAAWFRYSPEHEEHRVAASSYAAPVLFRIIPVRERLFEPHLELGIGLGMNRSVGKNAIGPAIGAGVGLGVRVLPGLRIGPQLRWLGVLAGLSRNCSAPATGASGSCTTGSEHVGVAALERGSDVHTRIVLVDFLGS